LCAHLATTEPTLIAKSSILLDVKPWDDETDMAKLEECVRSISMDGLLWGQCKCRKSALVVAGDRMTAHGKGWNGPAMVSFQPFTGNNLTVQQLPVLLLTAAG
jgi:hypothetical protein